MSWIDRYVSSFKGMNSRLDEIQAAVLSAKLPHLHADNDKRKRIAGLYDIGLAGTSITLPCTGDGVDPVFHQYVIRTSRRDNLREYLRARGIGTLVHYPVPVHHQPAYIGCRHGSMPVTEEAAVTVLSLPMYPELSHSDVDIVCDAIVEWDSVKS